MAGIFKGVGVLGILAVIFVVLASMAAPLTAEVAREAGVNAGVGSSSTSASPSTGYALDSRASFFYDDEEIVLLSKSSNPGDHDPNVSTSAKTRIENIWNEAQIKIGQNPEQTTALLYCAVVTYENGVTYVRLLLVATEGDTTGTMSWFGEQGWVHAFDGKDVYGFLNGNPRGALSYNTGMNLVDCINSIKGGLPAPNKIAP